MQTSEDPSRLFTEAVAAMNKQDYDTAVKKYAEVLRKLPNCVPCLANGTQALLLKGELERAEEWAQAAADRSPNDPTPWQVLSDVYNRQKNFAKALEAINVSATLAPAGPARASVLHAKAVVQPPSTRPREGRSGGGH